MILAQTTDSQIYMSEMLIKKLELSSRECLIYSKCILP